MKMSKLTCKDCTFFGVEVVEKGAWSSADSDLLQCRKYAPRVLHGSGTGWANQRWAEVNPAVDWCGELEEG